MESLILQITKNSPQMKSKIFKIAGVKNEDEFYKLFPTQESFMKKHGKAVKAQFGGNFFNVPDISSILQGQMQTPGVQATGINNYPSPQENVISIPNNQLGDENSGYAFPGGPINPSKVGGDNFSQYAQGAADIFGGIKALGAQKKQLKAAKQMRKVSDLQLKASATRPEQFIPEYVRPEDNIVSGEELFPIEGVGTNVLAKNGKNIPKAQKGKTVKPAKLTDDPRKVKAYNDSLKYHNSIYKVIPEFNYEKDLISHKKAGFNKPTGNKNNPIGLAYDKENSNKGDVTDSYYEVYKKPEQPYILRQREEQIPINIQGRGPLEMIPQSVSEIKQMARVPKSWKVNEDYGYRTLDYNVEDPSLLPATPMVKGQKRTITPQYQNGGWMQNTQFGDFMTSGGGESLNMLTKGLSNNSGGSQIGGGIGTVAGTALGGPIGGMVGKVAGGAIGSLIDRTPSKIKKEQRATMKNLQGMMLNNMGAEVQAGYASYMQNGGDIPNGDENIQIQWGGGVEQSSLNPYDDGTLMFRGNSHSDSDRYGNTGIGVQYGENLVEVEGDEPAMETEEGLTVFGNIKIPKHLTPFIGDDRAKNKKFKNYIADLSKEENKFTKELEDNVINIDDNPMVTSFDKLAFDTNKMKAIGANSKLAAIAEKKKRTAFLQDIINAEVESTPGGYITNDGVPKAQNGRTTPVGANIPYTVKGGNNPGTWSYTPIGQTGYEQWDKNYQTGWTPSVTEALSDDTRADAMIRFISNYGGEGWENVRQAINSAPTKEQKINLIQRLGTDGKVGPFHYVLKGAMDATLPQTTTSSNTTSAPVTQDPNTYEVVPYQRNKFVDMANQILPFIRPTNQEPLDPNQLMGEMYALSSNQVTPVRAQGYQPLLDTPYDISYQDQINAVNSDYRSSQRMTGYNPSAQGILNSQKYAATSNILAEQFRQNQAQKDGTYRGNRAAINDAKLKNLGIYDRQYDRQNQALSNTKATNQAALNSISDKIMKNKLENRQLGILENMYNYRYDAAGRAINMNPLFQVNTPTVYTTTDQTPNNVPIYDNNGNIIGYRSTGEKPSLATPSIKAKYGKSMKCANGDIIKMTK